jgi:hypothetical protein
MEILDFQQDIHLAAVYYNNGKLNLFRIHIDVMLNDLKHWLTQLSFGGLFLVCTGGFGGGLLAVVSVVGEGVEKYKKGVELCFRNLKLFHK